MWAPILMIVISKYDYKYKVKIDVGSYPNDSNK